MKTHPLDFIVSGLISLMLVMLSLTSIKYIFSPFTNAMFANYAILINGIIFLFLYGLFSGLLIHLLLKIYPLRCESISMDDTHFFYWKLLTVLHEFGRGSLLPFTTVFAKPVVSALFGAKMGKNIAMGGLLVDPWFITVSDNVILGLDTAIISHAITSGRIVLKPVLIKSGATIGVHAVVMPGVVIGENSVVTAGSVVKMDTVIPPNELWGGMPARKIKDISSDDVRG